MRRSRAGRTRSGRSASATTASASRCSDVNGGDAHPLYAWLTAQAPGLLGSEAIKWNFTKFLVRRDGSVFKRYAPQTSPESLAADIESLLAEPA